MSGNTSNKTTVAILPFQNQSESHELDYFFRGFVDDLNVDLSRFSELKVISQHSTAQLNPDTDWELIKTLRTHYLITGSFRVIEEGIRFQIQVIKSADGSIIFGGRHEETRERLHLAYDLIIQQLVNVIQQQININLLSETYQKQSANFEAYDYWLRGMAELKKGGLKHDMNARELFYKALSIDPNYARAYTGLSLSHFNEWSCQLWDRWQVSQDGAHDFALQAVALDPNDYKALTVLGRTYLYLGEFEKSENCVTKALTINPNDADNLANIATTLVYLDRLDKAEDLYKKACELNPLQPNAYLNLATFLYFMKCDFAQSIAMANKINMYESWVDLHAFKASAYFFLGQLELSNIAWQGYLQTFQEKITADNDNLEHNAIKWAYEINPFRSTSPLLEFLATKQPTDVLQKLKVEVKNGPKITNTLVFKRVDDLWEIAYNGRINRLVALKGFEDIAFLFQNAHRPVHCMELMGGVLESSEFTTIDYQAKKEYSSKLKAVQADIEEAEMMQNYEQANELRVKYDNLVDHLTSAMGLGGKLRKKGSSVEKARSAVTWRIRTAIKKIAEVNPDLGKHLQVSIKTGTTCCYQPEQDLVWEVG